MIAALRRSDRSSRTPSAVVVDPVWAEAYVTVTNPVGTGVTHSHRAGARTPVSTCDGSIVVGASSSFGARAMAVSRGVETVDTSDAVKPLVQRFTGCDGLTGTTDPATPVAERMVTSHASIDSEDVDSRHHLEHRTELMCGSHTPDTDTDTDTDAGAESPTVSAGAEVEGLNPDMTHFHLDAGSEASGSFPGPDQTFTTTPALSMADVVTPCVPAITPRPATVQGSVSDNSSLFVNDHLHHTTTTASGSTADRGQVVRVAGLESRMTCRSLRGLGATLPASVSTAPFRTGVSTNTATLTLTGTTFGATGSRHFEPAALDGSCPVLTRDGGSAAVADAQPVGVTLTGLAAGNGGATGGLGAVPNGASSLWPRALVPMTTSRTPNLSPAGKPVNVTPTGCASATAADPPSRVSTGHDPRTVFGCVSPHTDSYDKRSDQGDVITIASRDLGLSGIVASGDESLTPTDGNQTGFKVQAPDDTEGTSALTATGSRSRSARSPTTGSRSRIRPGTAPRTVRPVDR
jgi:microcystin-dependent protein